MCVWLVENLNVFFVGTQFVRTAGRSRRTLTAQAAHGERDETQSSLNRKS